MRAMVLAFGFATILSATAFTQSGGADRTTILSAHVGQSTRIVAQTDYFSGPRIVLAQMAPQANDPQTSWQFGPQQGVYPDGQ